MLKQFERVNRLTTELKIIIAALLIAGCAIASYWLQLYRYEEEKSNMVQLSIKTSENIKHLPLYAELYVNSGNREYLIALRSTVEEVNEAIGLFKNGGSYIFDDKRIKISPLSVQSSENLESLTVTFTAYKEKIDKIVGELLYEQETNYDISTSSQPRVPKIRETILNALDYVKMNQQELFMYNELIRENYIKEANKYISLQQFSGLIIFLIILFLLFYIVYLYRSRVTREIVYLENAAKSVLMANKLPQNHKVSSDFKIIYEQLNTISENMRDAINFAKNISRNDNKLLSTTEKQNPVISSLVEMKERLLSISADEEKRKWSINGVAQVSDLLRKYQDKPIEELCFEFIKHIVKYTNSNQGGVYLIQDEDINDLHIKLVAQYAFEKRKYTQQRLNMRQGLLGQAIFEKDQIYIQEVPANYLHITSGLGEANPRTLVITPIMFNDDITGAIEIASFYQLAPHQLLFIKTACERLCSAVIMHKNSYRTQKLLEKAEILNQELLRSNTQTQINARELEATQQELSIKYRELKQQTNFNTWVLEAINKTNAVIEYDMDGNILSVNDMCLAVIGYTREEIVGRNERILLVNDPKEEERHQMKWESLRNGAFISGEYKRVSKAGKEIWLNGTYNPIFNIEGKPFKVMQLAQFTTEEKERELDMTSKINALSDVFPILDLDLDGNIRRANQVFLDKIEINRSEAKNTNIAKYVKSSMLKEDIYISIQHMVINKKSTALLLPFVTEKNKEICYYMSYFYPIADLSGKVYKILLFLVEVTEQIQKQNELAHSLSIAKIQNAILNYEDSEENDMLNRLLGELMPVLQTINQSKLKDIVMACQTAALQINSDEGNVININNACCKLLALSDTEQIAAKQIFKDEKIYEAVVRGDAFEAKTTLKTTTDTSIDVKIIVVPIFLENHETQALVFIIT
jgi:PAS domain S-box-containing protein